MVLPSELCLERTARSARSPCFPRSSNDSHSSEFRKHPKEHLLGIYQVVKSRAVGKARGLIVVASPPYLARRGVPDRPAALANPDIIFSTMHQRPSEWRFGPKE